MCEQRGERYEQRDVSEAKEACSGGGGSLSSARGLMGEEQGATHNTPLAQHF